MATSNSIHFVLNAFDSQITLDICGSLFKYQNIPTIDADATAVYYISLNDMKNAFNFQTDAFDVTNANSTDLKYLIDMDYFPW